jgi:uncharacterized protein
MGKFLLIAVLCLVVWWMWRKLQATRSGSVHEKSERPPELMVRCAHCGVNQPQSECVQGREAGVLYCSEAHRQEAEPGAGGA